MTWARLQAAGHELGRPRRQRAPCARSRARSCCSTTRTSRSWSPSRRARRSSATRAPRPHDVPRDQVAQFYKDFLNTPGTLNRGHTHPRVLDGGLRRPLRRRPDRVRPVPDAGQVHEYGMEFQARHRLPGRRHLQPQHPHRRPRRLGRRRRRRGRRASSTSCSSCSAGQDESSTWQEFGPMKFPTKEDVTDDFGPPDPALPNWSHDPLRRRGPRGRRARRHLAERRRRLLDPGRELRHGASSPTSSATSSASATTTTTRTACRRAATTPASGRCSAAARFNGPGGPHSRWLIPPTGGASMGAQHMLRNKIKLQMVDERERAAAVARGAGRVGPGGRPGHGPRGRSPARTSCPGVNIALDTGDHEPGVRRQHRPVVRRRRLQQLHGRGRRPDGHRLLHPRRRRAAGQDQEPGPRAVRVGRSTPTRRTST